MKRRFLVIIITLFVLGLSTTLPAAFAASNGEIAFNGTVLVEGVTCETSRLQISQRWLSTTADFNSGGQDQDYTAYVVLDGADRAIATGVFGTPVGSNFSFTDSVNLNSTNPIAYRPLTISLHDIIGSPVPIATLPSEERAEAILNLARLAISTFDPATVLDVCAAVPMASLPNAAPLLNYFTTDMPTVAWNPISWADNYELQLADNAAFAGATTYPLGNDLAFTVLSPLADATHYWRVRACLAAACGSWSMMQYFVVDSP